MGKADRRASAMPWLVAFAVVSLLIWCNSLVPGEASDGMSMAVLADAQGFLAGWGFDPTWLSNHFVRKIGHFCEYMALGAIAVPAFGLAAHDMPLCRRIAGLIAMLVVACVDETIQLFVPGRCGMMGDVVLDWCGLAFGALLATVAVRAVRRARS